MVLDTSFERGAGLYKTVDPGKAGRADQSFLMPKAVIAGRDYDGSVNPYRHVAAAPLGFKPPDKILAELAASERGTQTGLDHLGSMLRALA